MSFSFDTCFYSYKVTNNPAHEAEVKAKNSTTTFDDNDQENYNPSERTNQIAIHCIRPSLTDATSQSIYANDNILIEEALKNYDELSLTITQDAFKKYLLNRLDLMRPRNQLVECQGLRGTNEKGIKYVFQLTPNKVLKRIDIGRYFIKGGFTKVYLTTRDKAILVPRKDQNKSKTANDQMSKARNNCLSIHIKYNLSEKHSEKIQTLLTSLNLFQNNFEKETQLIKKMLPPLPELVDANHRPIMIMPKATPAAEIFEFPPKDVDDILKRLTIMLNIATTLALLHDKNFVHADIKPDNMLVNSEGEGQLHDFGGSAFFDNPQDTINAADKFSSLTCSVQYTHYQDRVRYKIYEEEKKCEVFYLKLGQARDVFSLAVSAIRAMIGILDLEGNKQLPYHIDAYVIRDYGTYKRTYINGTVHQRTPVTCLAAICPKADAVFQKLLDRALHPESLLRPSANEFAITLHQICETLKASGS